MSPADAFFLLAGVAVVAVALMSGMRTVVLPRAAQDPVARRWGSRLRRTAR